jgi:protein involved in polysaccharide export with SLBB domain
MAHRFWYLLALLAVTVSPVLHSHAQSLPGLDGSAGAGSLAGAAQAQQGGSTGCSQTSLDPLAQCNTDQTQVPQQQSPYGVNGLSSPSLMGAAASESLTGQSNQQTATGRAQALQFPPDMPTEFQKFAAETTGRYLPIYGQNLFRTVPSTFSPSDLAPVPAEYVIGPDDELRVRIWGEINFSGNLRVDRSGDIYLPQVGAIQVAGLQYSALDQRLRSAVARLFRNFDLSVDIGRIRSIQVYVSGQARRPGAYTISSLSSLVDALFATGGPSPEGSLRHVLLKRGGATVTDFDLYGLLIHGDKSGDIALLPEDVLYIPPSGPQVAITGSVRNQGIYELKRGETIGDLVDMAGQTTAVASDSRISLQRVEDHSLSSVMEINFDAAGRTTVLADGDIVRIDPIVPAYSKVVTLRGNVANPGRFGWRAGMRLSDLIPDLDSLVSRDYWWKRSHLGLPSPEFEPAISTLGEPPNSSTPTPSSNASVSGMQETVTNALTPKTQETEENTGTKDKNSGLLGANGTIASELTQVPATPGTLAPQRNTIRLLGDQINWNYAVIERIDPQSLKPSLISFDLGKLVLEHDPSADLTLEAGDTVTIFSQTDIHVPLDQQVKYIELEGEFVHSGYYSISPGETLRDVVLRAGGLTPRAYLYGSEFTRESARILQQQRLDDYVRSLTLEAERGTQALALTSTSSSSAMSDVTASRELTEEMVNRLNQVKATGRIVLEFRAGSSSLEDIPAIALENGDKFVVPFAPANVNVVGAVYDQNSYVFEHGRSLGYYLQLAGGANRNADWHHAFLIRADGSVISRNHTQGTGFWKESFNDLKLNPGDTIVVPDKTLRPTALRGLIDWSQIFSQFALGAAAVNVL